MQEVYWLIALGAATIVNVMASVAVGRRFRMFAVGMSAAWLATAVTLLRYVVLPLYRTDWW